MRIQLVRLFIALVSISLSYGCSDGKRVDEEKGVTDLQQNRSASGTISEVGEVDWYRMRVDSPDTVLRMQLSSNTYRADVDLLATVYELDASGEKVRLYADHAPEDSQVPANVEINIGVSTPQDIYISVRDLMDDESSNNPYFLSVDLSESSDGNDNFTDAETLVVDNENTCHQDSIAYVGDLDSYTFDIAQSGVYQLLTDFSPFAGGTDVGLNIKLYDDSGNVIETLYQGQGNRYSMVRYLGTGTYFALVEDYGRDDFDTASSFDICLNSVATSEAGGNDESDSATTLTETTSNSYTLSGSLDYNGDEDWYRLSPSGLSNGDFQVLNLNFDTSASLADNTVYLIEIRDADGNIVLSHDHNGASTAFQTQVRVAGGDHYIHVLPSPDQVYSSHLVDGEVVGASYTAAVDVVDVEDAAETGAANNTIDTAIALAPTSTDSSGWTNGKIAYRGDDDWFEVTVDTDNYQVLELFLETDSASAIEYSVAVMRDTVEKRLADMDGSDGATSLKTSLLIAPTESGDPVTYYIKVGDYQSDDGDADNAYRIRTNVVDVPTTIPLDAAVSGPIAYYSEITEQLSDDANNITLEHNSSIENDYLVDVTLLDFDSETPNPDVSSVTVDEVTTFTFPWVAGYVDYQGDQDWFKLNLDGLRSRDDTDWYYDIQVELHVGNPGSSVEYVWKLYRDRGQNRILVDGVTTTGDGFFASAGDTGTSQQAIDIATPDGDDPFWANQDWQGAFYFSMSDFNYVAETLPEDDWGYDLPYYFRVTLIYHPGVSRPE